MSNQLSGKLVNVDAFEVVELLSLETEDNRTKDDRYVDATAVEYFSVPAGDTTTPYHDSRRGRSWALSLDLVARAIRPRTRRSH
jgi:hypothetical protein